MSWKVTDLRPQSDQASKPTELIQMTGHEELTLNARRSITILWHEAHKQGFEEGKDYTIEVSDLCPPRHNGRELVEEAVITLMKTILTIRRADGSVRRVQFLGGNDLDSEDRPSGTLTYSFDKRLVEVLKESSIWGKISIPILMTLSSKYAVSLYENVAQWTGLSHKTSQTFSLEEFREMLGVEEDVFPRFGNLNNKVLKPITKELNALAPFNISILPIKTGRKVTAIRLGWWVKSLEESQAAWREVQNTKLGRKARISGQTCFVFSPSPSAKKLSTKSVDKSDD